LQLLPYSGRLSSCHQCCKFFDLCSTMAVESVCKVFKLRYQQSLPPVCPWWRSAADEEPGIKVLLSLSELPKKRAKKWAWGWPGRSMSSPGSNYKGRMLFRPVLKACPIGTVDLCKLRQGFEVFITNAYFDVPPVLWKRGNNNKETNLWNDKHLILTTQANQPNCSSGSGVHFPFWQAWTYPRPLRNLANLSESI
jgi:hypothetical protein